MCMKMYFGLGGFAEEVNIQVISNLAMRTHQGNADLQRQCVYYKCVLLKQKGDLAS